jgi:hypothetical protein
VREADHPPPSSAEVKNAWSYTSTFQYVFMAWCSVKTSIVSSSRPFSYFSVTFGSSCYAFHGLGPVAFSETRRTLWKGDRPIARPLLTQASTTKKT